MPVMDGMVYHTSESRFLVLTKQAPTTRGLLTGQACVRADTSAEVTAHESCASFLPFFVIVGNHGWAAWQGRSTAQSKARHLMAGSRIVFTHATNFEQLSIQVGQHLQSASGLSSGRLLAKKVTRHCSSTDVFFGLSLQRQMHHYCVCVMFLVSRQFFRCSVAAPRHALLTTSITRQSAAIEPCREDDGRAAHATHYGAPCAAIWCRPGCHFIPRMKSWAA
uniref:Uncharacterized protein n=1 Tax=Chlamydomonas euryale TaxID=1486919 RepID=A0A7R9V5B5_9CHLO|mmetsp:Transcript_17096/g.51293  ORF Transcript_17096/g.51293 Transcript_17096/m.51293 type:complete len:221 (+) Transcript_17096:155-817(+)